MEIALNFIIDVIICVAHTARYVFVFPDNIFALFRHKDFIVGETDIIDVGISQFR